MNQDEKLELIDGHIVGLSDEEDLEKILRNGREDSQKGVMRNLKYICPLLCIFLGIFFTFGFLLGSTPTYPNPFHASFRNIGGNNSAVAEIDISKMSAKLDREERENSRLRRAVADLTSKWEQMSDRLNGIDRLTEQQKRLESLEKEEREQLNTLRAKIGNVADEVAHEKQQIDDGTKAISELEAEIKSKSGSEDTLVAFSKGAPLDISKLLNGVNLNDVRTKVVGLKKLLEDYWKGGKILMDTMHLSEGPVHEQGIKYMSDKFARAILYGSKFVIGAMGSSVTAGHDNCNYDSYERQMERTLGPVLKLANVDFVVRNAGEGGACGDSFENQIWCVRHMLGDDIDIAHYSWTYFEAGRDMKEIHETWARFVLLMDRAPVPQFLHVDGRNEKECERAVDYTGKLFEVYGKYGLNIACLQKGISKEGFPKKEWGRIGDGTHTTTRYGEFSNVTDARRKSLGVAFRNWHPGPLGFQVVSDAFVYEYSKAILMALDQISETLEKNNNNKSALVSRWPRKPKMLSQTQIPKPVHCNPAECDLEEPPGCTNWEIPTYGRGQIRIMKPKDSMNPFKDLVKETDKGWKMWTADKRNLIPRDEMEMEGCSHLDVCAGVQGFQDSGLLTLRLPRMNKGRIIVCSPDGKKGGDTLVKDVEFRVESTIISAPKTIYGKCVLVQNSWSSSGVSDSKGHIHLGVQVKTKDSIGVRLSHVIAY
ncbi:hypothetical protein AAMO2058_001221300 [Amorphochlora amoebiformis]